MFITLSIVLERMRYEGVVDLFQTVKTLRTQRPAMVQTEVRGGPCRVFLLLKLLLSYFTFNFKCHLIKALERLLSLSGSSSKLPVVNIQTCCANERATLKKEGQGAN